MDTVKAFVGQATTSVGGGEEGGFMEEIQGHLSLSKKHRLIGFGACMGLGILFLFISTTLFLFPTKFAFTYTTANLMLMGSTVFLIGPIRQLKMMFDPSRFLATIAYFFSLFLALFCALKLKNFFLTIIAIIIEAVAITWYALSYIPFARSMVKSALSACFPRVF
ncbi:unnamed protein product [Calypogeia fissa]